jgi:hypothetical protein
MTVALRNRVCMIAALDRSVQRDPKHVGQQRDKQHRSTSTPA